MSQTSFFKASARLTVHDIALLLNQPIPDGVASSEMIFDVRAIDEATEGDATFLDNAKYLPLLENCKASLIFCKKRYADQAPSSAIVWATSTPYHAYAKVAAELYPNAMMPPYVLDGGDDKASNVRGYLHKSAKVEARVVVEPTAAVGENVEIGQGTVVAAGAVIGRNVTIGRDCFIGPNSVVQHAVVGNNVTLHPGVCVGQDGFGYAMGADGHLKVPQLGRVVIQDDVDIGANSCVDRGTNRDTVIGEGTKIDNQVQIGHNVQIGRHCVIVGQVAIAGSATLGDFVVIGGQTGVIGHVAIGDGAQVAGVSAVHGDVPKGARWGGVPAKPVRDWFKEATLLTQLAKKDVIAVEKRAGYPDDDVKK